MKDEYKFQGWVVFSVAMSNQFEGCEEALIVNEKDQTQSFKVVVPVGTFQIGEIYDMYLDRVSSLQERQ